MSSQPAPHSAETLAWHSGKEPTDILDLVTCGPLRTLRGYRVVRVDAADLVNHGLRTSDRWLAVSRCGRFQAHGSGPEEAAEELRWELLRDHHTRRTQITTRPGRKDVPPR